MSERSAGGSSPSRRELIARALAGAAAASITAPAGAGAASGGGDAKVLAGLLREERKLSAIYHHVLASGLLNVVVSAEISGFLDQEQQHIGALERELSLRGTIPAAEPRLSAPSRAETQPDALDMLLGAESMAESAYLGALSKFEDPALVTLAAEIMASEAQHWSLLRALQNPGNLVATVPAAFVTGSS
jgi:hypothetical protein